MNTLDRLYLKKWFLPTLGTMVTFVLLFLIVDVFGLLEDLMANWPGTVLLFRYLLFRTGYAIFFLSPMAFLIGGYWMSETARRQQEWTVSLLGGRNPLYLIKAPLVALTGATLVFILANIFLMPHVAAEVNHLRDYVFEGETPDPVIYEEIHLRLMNNRTVRIDRFRPDEQTMTGIIISERKGSRIPHRIDAKNGTYRPGTGWEMTDVEERNFEGGQAGRAQSQPDRVLPVPPPDVLAQVLRADPGRSDRNPIEYVYSNLKQSIQFKANRKMNALPEKIFLHWKVGFPLTNLVLGLLGLAIGFRGNLGRATGIGVCLLVGFGYWILYSLAISTGKSARVTGVWAKYVHLLYVYGPPLVILGGTYVFWKKNE